MGAFRILLELLQYAMSYCPWIDEKSVNGVITKQPMNGISQNSTILYCYDMPVLIQYQ